MHLSPQRRHGVNNTPPSHASKQSRQENPLQTHIPRQNQHGQPPPPGISHFSMIFSKRSFRAALLCATMMVLWLGNEWYKLLITWTATSVLPTSQTKNRIETKKRGEGERGTQNGTRQGESETPKDTQGGCHVKKWDTQRCKKRYDEKKWDTERYTTRYRAKSETQKATRGGIT